MSENTIESIQQEINGEFALFDEWLDRYEYIIELGKQVPPIDEQFKTDAYLIPGCQSQVWLNAEAEDGRLYFSADSDAIITKGIIGLLIRVLSGQKAAEIAQADLHFIDDIGLQAHLSPSRSNGLLSMVKRIKDIANAAK